MKRTNYFIPTLKEKPQGIEQEGQILMFRAGMLKKVSSGLFVYLPLMQRVIEKVNKVIKEKMESVNSVWCKFPILVSKDELEASGRWNSFGKEMFRLKDRHNISYAISPTNEEAACFVASSYIRSYKDLPFSLYQIGSKHRDEISPRNGVMRAREFTMKDAYSFHEHEKCLDEYYSKMKIAYLQLFRSLSLDIVSVFADTGAMGGSGSEEIMALIKSGETKIASCKACGYAANNETVSCGKDLEKIKIVKTESSLKKVHTPNIKTIAELVSHFNKTEKDFVKAVMFLADKKLVMALVRGDREVNEVKLKNALSVAELESASVEKIVKSKKTYPGFSGPVNIKGIKIIADLEIKKLKDFIIGANEKDYHYENASISDFSKCDFIDIREVAEGDECPSCGKALSFQNATELGHIFKLGARYTDILKIKYTSTDGALKTPIMGCYGIGVERTIAAIVEQHHDEKGIIWPMDIAPFKVNLITVDMQNEEQVKVSKMLYDELNKKGIETIWDNTLARPGSKFIDCELIGYPLRVVVGRGATNGKIELVNRKSGEKLELDINKATEKIASLV